MDLLFTKQRTTYFNHCTFINLSNPGQELCSQTTTEWFERRNVEKVPKTSILHLTESNPSIYNPLLIPKDSAISLESAPWAVEQEDFGIIGRTEGGLPELNPPSYWSTVHGEVSLRFFGR